MLYTNEKIGKQPRHYYKSEFDATSWDNVGEALNKLIEANITSVDELTTLIEKYSELSFILEEAFAWKYIKMTCNADDKKYSNDYNDFYKNIIAKSQPYDFKFKKKIYDSKFKNQLPETYNHFIRMISVDIELFREENIPLMIEENELSNKYGEFMSQLTVEFEGKEQTLIQMGKYLKENDRNIRESAWEKVNNKLIENNVKLNDLYTELIKIRVQIAKNADFENYRDFMHVEKGRFDYTVDDVKEFHSSIETTLIPYIKTINEERKTKLGLNQLRPWDMDVDPDGRLLKPFKNSEEFVDKAINILHKLSPEFGDNLEKMKNSDFLDLENRKGKSPGGYNYPLAEHGAAFIFMNAIGLNDDVRTLLHESGHAMHSYSIADQSIYQYKNTPSEVAELASMSMELLTVDLLHEYYPDEEDFKKAKRDQLEGTLLFMPWAMVVDEFQQWVYTNPDNSMEEREKYFSELMDRFNAGIDWSNLEDEKKVRWLRQLHIFEVPFYYIEYAIAQLGALAIYKNYKTDQKKALEDYKSFLKLGYSKSMTEVYNTAGIEFSFSKEYISSIVEFVKDELSNI